MESDDEYQPTSSPPLKSVLSLNQKSRQVEADTYLARPNRYFGPDSTWLSWTEQERLVAQLLDQERSQNLGLHLVQAHAMKRKASAELSRTSRNKKGKQRASSADSDTVQEMSRIEPPKRWSAWPLPVDEVPRDDDHLATGNPPGKGNGLSNNPSTRLEQSLIATTTRLARERWELRQWMEVKSKDEETQSEAIAKSHNARVAVSRESEASDAAETLSSDSESQRDGDAPMAYSQTYLAEEAEEKEEDGLPQVTNEPKSDSEEEQTPTPMADDEEARHLLLPSIRQAMSKFDDLLIGLHKARLACTPGMSRGRRNSETSDTDEEGLHVPRSRSRSRSRARTRRRSYSRILEHSADSRQSEGSEGPTRPLGLRDWSDVVGMAALIGWDLEVVQRASERCAKFFKENMILRTFHEGNSRLNEPPYYEEHYAAVPLDQMSDEDNGSDTEYKLRTTAACEACSKYHRKCELADTLISRGPCKSCLDFGEKCSGIEAREVKERHRCPFRFCERHHITFEKHHKLQRHLEAVHNEDRVPSASSPARSSASERYLASTDLPACPVEDCPRHDKAFSEGSKLYRHLRKMHPEVDVDEVKRLEVLRRGERRGRWRDESRRSEISKRNRSKSQGLPSSPPVRNTQNADEDE